MRELAGNVHSLRMSYLCDIEDAGADAEAEQYYLLALTMLEQAQRYLSIAAYKQSQALR
jgi:hypothetical protein